MYMYIFVICGVIIHVNISRFIYNGPYNGSNRYFNLVTAGDYFYCNDCVCGHRLKPECANYVFNISVCV